MSLNLKDPVSRSYKITKNIYNCSTTELTDMVKYKGGPYIHTFTVKGFGNSFDENNRKFYKRYNYPLLP